MNTKLLQLSKLLNLTTHNIGSCSEATSLIYAQYFHHKVNASICSNGKAQSHHNFDDAHTNQAHALAPESDDVWIFGYGSLVWKADFPYIDRRRGYICGYQRRFYQHSIDHRGTHEKPGRVVTLLPTNVAEDRVYGVAYRIAAQQKQDVLSHLDYREKNGYERCTLQFHEFPEAGQFEIIMYVATHGNDSYAGAVWQVPRIAEQIFTSAGPSGPNREYLYNLANAMRELFPGVQDEHLFELERELLELVERKEQMWLEQALKREILAALEEPSDADVAKVADRIEALKQSCEKAGWKEALLTKQLQIVGKDS